MSEPSTSEVSMYKVLNDEFIRISNEIRTTGSLPLPKILWLLRCAKATTDCLDMDKNVYASHTYLKNLVEETRRLSEANKDSSNL